MEKTVSSTQAPEALQSELAQEADSKKQILKSTGILGFSQVLIILIGVVRIKVLAVLLGAVGVGVAGLYQSTVDMVRAATGLGLRASAVREIATAAATGDARKTATAIRVLRGWVWATGLFGALLALLASRPLSRWAFGTTDYAAGIAVLSVTILIAALSDGQSALLQGLRKISVLARANIAAALAGLVGATVIYWYWGAKGIVPALLVVSATTFLWNWYYARQVKTVPVTLSAGDIFTKGKAMARLGLYMSVTAIAGTGVLYFTRAFVVEQVGLAAAGHFSAAWTISSMYLSAIFGAMSGDYFPRLSAVQQDPAAMRRMVNEQTEISLLIVAPVIILMITFIKIVVRLFYSKDFGPTAYILDWQLLGDFFKTLAWPIGFVLLATGRGRLYLTIELGWSAVFLGSLYLLWPSMGLATTGFAFLLAYGLYAVVLFFLIDRKMQFSFSKAVRKQMAVFLPLLVLAFSAQRFLASPYNLLAGSALSLVAIGFSYFGLRQVLPVDRLLRRLLPSKK